MDEVWRAGRKQATAEEQTISSVTPKRMSGLPTILAHGRISAQPRSADHRSLLDLVSRQSLADQLREIVIGGPSARTRAAAAAKKQAKKDKMEGAAKEEKQLEKQRRKWEKHRRR